MSLYVFIINFITCIISDCTVVTIDTVNDLVAWVWSNMLHVYNITSKAAIYLLTMNREK